MANSVDPDQVPQFAASDLGLHCFSVHTCQGYLIFYKVRKLLGKSVMCEGKIIFCKNVKEMSGHITFLPDEDRM